MSYQRTIRPDSTSGFYKKEAKNLLKQFRNQAPSSLELFRDFHPEGEGLMDAKLSDAQLVIARHYRQKTWPHLLKVVESNEQFRLLENAFKSRDKKGIHKILNKYQVLFNRLLLRTAVLYGDLEMVKFVYELGARDIQDALGQAIYSCAKDITDFLVSKGGNMEGNDRYGLIGSSSCELLNLDSLKFTLSYRSHPIPKDVLEEYFMIMLGTYVRKPSGKHECIRQLINQGLELEGTPIMAFHQGRIDLLEKHLEKDPELLHRRFSLVEIFPAPYFRSETDGLHLTPLEGTTLLHLAVEYDEREIMHWLIEKGADVNITSEIDDQGFGGHTPLFHTTVTFTPGDTSKVVYLLEHGANPHHCCSIRKQLKYTSKRHMAEFTEFMDVTPITFAEQWKYNAHQLRSLKALKVLDEYSRKSS